MATVSCRALYVVRWYEVSRVLGVSPTLATTRNYRNETWCRRWWHISQRSLSLTANTFAPSLSPILAKEVHGLKGTPKHAKISRPLKATSDSSLLDQNAETTGRIYL
ncbi:hypothetical protein KM043_017887 [Ampulex compressa]|nr:hypothetical protein KM043_017887 [Ampulex compressa]